MLHAARQLPAWLIYDVGQNIESSSMRTIESEVAVEAARRTDRAGTVSSASDAGRAAGHSGRRQCAVVLAVFRQCCSGLVRAADATQSGTLPRRSSPLSLRDPTLRSRRHRPCRLMKSRVFVPPCAIRAAAAGELPDPPNKAPEPTSTSVTSRAIVCFPEMKRWTEKPIEARAAPAVAVAHL